MNIEKATFKTMLYLTINNKVIDVAIIKADQKGFLHVYDKAICEPLQISKITFTLDNVIQIYNPDAECIEKIKQLLANPEK